MMDHDLFKQNWNSRGYSFGIFKDPPGQVWADFVHKTDELVVLAEGEIEIEIEGKSQRLQIGGKCLSLLMLLIQSGMWGACGMFGIMGLEKQRIENGNEHI